MKEGKNMKNKIEYFTYKTPTKHFYINNQHYLNLVSTVESLPDVFSETKNDIILKIEKYIEYIQKEIELKIAEAYSEGKNHDKQNTYN